MKTKQPQPILLNAIAQVQAVTRARHVDKAKTTPYAGYQSMPVITADSRSRYK